MDSIEPVAAALEGGDIFVVSHFFRKNEVP